jgi:hypothetical protein
MNCGVQRILRLPGFDAFHPRIGVKPMSEVSKGKRLDWTQRPFRSPRAPLREAMPAIETDHDLAFSLRRPLDERSLSSMLSASGFR